ncbi:MAG: hypothetical protein K6G26_00510 [Lachnospiraceae bacterium]|nr:hypothetical protein [Lachnospiraceae bacterium]
MKLNINSPAYYSEVYGIDDEVYRMCQNLRKYFMDKNYNDTIEAIGICPIIAPKAEITKGLWKEVKKVEIKHGFALVSLQMDYEIYINVDIEKKKAMIIENVLKSVQAIKSRAKFDYKSFENDMKIFCEENNIIFDLEKIEKLLFERTIKISNKIAQKKYNLLCNKGLLEEFLKNDIISVLGDYGGEISIVEKNEYPGKFNVYLSTNNSYLTELDLIVDGFVIDLKLVCEFYIQDNKIISEQIKEIV